jgi:hypothetical protein
MMAELYTLGVCNILFLRNKKMSLCKPCCYQFNFSKRIKKKTKSATFLKKKNWAGKWEDN